jgi:hypothetical protein
MQEGRTPLHYLVYYNEKAEDPTIRRVFEGAVARVALESGVKSERFIEFMNRPDDVSHIRKNIVACR